jgi:hypothetical protein
MRFSNWALALFLTVPLHAALDFNSGNFGTFGMSDTILLFTPTGGTGPYVFSYAPSATPIPNFRVINAPELPTYATTSQKGGLAGLPLTPGTKSTTIRLTDTSTNLFIDKAINFTVSPVDLIGYGPNYYSVGDTVSQNFWPVGGTPPYTYSLSGTLPPGLSLVTQVINGVSVAVVSGVISGTANTATTTTDNHYNFTITVKDSVGNSLGRGMSMPVSAMQLWLGGAPLNLGTNRNLPNATVNLAYSQQISVVGGTAPYTFSVATLNALPNTLTLSSTGLISGTPNGSNFNGRFTITVIDAANHYMTARLALKILPLTPVPLAFSTTTLGGSYVGSGYDWGVYATGGLPPYTFDVDPATPLPAGVVLIQGSDHSPGDWDPDPADLRERVQTPGIYTFNLRVTDSAGNRASHAFSLDVAPLSTFYIFSPGATGSGVLGNAVLGTPYAQYLIPLGGTPPYTITPISVPNGLTIDNSGLLSGTPQEAGITMPLTFTLGDAGTHPFASPGNISIASSTNPGLTLSGGDFGVVSVGSQFASGLSASGSAQNPPVFTVSLVSGALPPGMKLLTGNDFNNNGNTALAAQLAGIPSTPGVYTFVYRVVDGQGQVGQRQIKLRVSGMTIVNTAFAAGTVGVPYTQTIDVRDGTPPYTFSLPSGSLPPGLSLNPSNGTITGTPTSTNSIGITIQVQDSAGDILQRGFTLNLYAIQITGPDVLPNGIFNEPYSYIFNVTPSGSYTFTASGLPSGLTLDSNIGLLSGTLAVNGTFVFTITAYNNATAAVVVRTFTMFVSTLSNLGFIGGLTTNVINVGGVPTPYLGDFVVGINQVTVLGMSGGVPPYSVSVPPGTLPPGLALATGSDYQGTTNFGRPAIAGVPTTPGVYTFKLTYSDLAGNAVDRVVAMNITTLGLVTANPSIATVNQPYSAQLYGTGGNGSYTFALVTAPYLQANVMPPGLTLSPTGLISGTPTSTGIFNPNIQLTSGASTRRVLLSITINATSDNRRIDFGLSPILGTFVTGKNASVVFAPTGGAGTHSWSLVSGTLPPGLQLLTNANLPPGFTAPTSLLAGVATTAGTYNIRIRVDDSTGNFGIKDSQLVVSAARIAPNNVPFFATTTSPPAQIGSPYSFAVSLLNARPPLAFTTETGTYLPGGVTADPSGLESGTPTTAGNFVIFSRITDADGNVRYSSGSINVYPANKPIGINTVGGPGTLLPSGTLTVAYALSLNDFISPGYGTPPFTWTRYDGTLPPGISITPGSGLASATLSGTPTTPGTYTFSLLVTDANAQQSLLKSVQLTVSQLGLTPLPGALPAAIGGVSYLTSLTPFGGTPPYTFTTEYDSDMPVGLFLSPSGVISGTPSTIGPFLLYVIVTDAHGNSFRQRYTLNVLSVGTVIPAFTLSPASINISYTRGDPAPAPIPISVASVSTPLAYTVSTGGTPWLSTTALSGTTPGSPSAIISPGTMAAGNYSGSISFTSPGASNSPASIPVNLSIVNAVVCSYLVAPTAGTAQASSGSGSFTVVATPGACTWAIDTASLPSWITITSSTVGSGNSPVTYSVAANPGSTPRTGIITVAGVPYTLTQFGTACSFTLQPSTVNLPSGGGSGPIAVNASGTGCTWNATQVDSWITLASGTGTGSGSGSVNLNFGPNSNGSSRTGTMTIAGQTLTVNEAGANCTFSLSSPGTTLGSSGGAASFNVTALNGCAWSADTGPGWISPTAPATGNGNGTVSLSIAPNSAINGRLANVLVGGQRFSVQQSGVPCSFSLSANNPVQSAAGGSGSVDITTNAGCPWTATSSAPTWLVPATNTGTGAGTVSFSVAANGTGAARSAVLTIVGQTITVNQSGPACAYSLQSGSANVPGGGGSGSLGVITVAGCGPWTAASGDPSWLTVTGGGTGPGSVTYSAAGNLTGVDRFATLTVAGQTFSVTQPAQACPVTLGSASSSSGEFGGSGQFTFTTTPSGCNVTVQSYSSWLTVTGQSPPGTISFTVAPNTYAAGRSGSIMVGDQTYVVNQAPSTCAYTLTSFAASFSRLGGDGTVPMTFTPAACGAPPVLVNGPPGMVTLTPGTVGPGSYTQNYTVAIYQSFINYVRIAQMVINGQIFTVKQTSW